MKAEMTNTDTDEIKNAPINIRLENKECETLPDKAFILEAALWKHVTEHNRLSNMFVILIATIFFTWICGMHPQFCEAKPFGD